MIKLDNVTMHDFLNRKIVQELLNVGVDMSDATYCISDIGGEDYILYGKVSDVSPEHNPVPTYTIAQLHFKLHEHIYPTIDGVDYSGGLRYVKDAPFYIFYYDLKHDIKDENGNILKTLKKSEYISAEGESPIESLAYLLIQCHKKGTGITYKDGTPCNDIGSITSKYSEYKWK